MAFNSPEDWIQALQVKTMNPDGEYMDFFNRWTDALRRNFDIGHQLRPIIGSSNSQFYKEVDKVANRLNSTIEDVGREAANKLAMGVFSAILGTGLFALITRGSQSRKKNRKRSSRKYRKTSK